MSFIRSTVIDNKRILDQLYDVQSQAKFLAKKEGLATNTSQSSFLNLIKDAISSVNEAQKVSDKMSIEIASGKSENLHEAMLAATKAELGFNLMVQIRNKVLEAYQEIMRMPV